jgi:hypothetical protein
MVDSIKPLLNTSKLISELKLKVSKSEKNLRDHHEKSVNFLEKLGVAPKDIRYHASKIAASAAITGMMFLSSPAIAGHLPLSASKYASYSKQDLQSLIGQRISELLPQEKLLLSKEVEIKIMEIVKEIFDINIVPIINNERLNHDYGFMGAEQHLPRYPGDDILQHDNFQESGMTSGRGAWGYFANSQNELNNDLISKEKYYVAVQTLYLPDWNTRSKYLADFYKYRKVAVINPVNGKIIICVIADSGPAYATGKQFGGSPEVMNYLNLKDGSQKGKVVLFFVDDPDNNVPLGPLEKTI